MEKNITADTLYSNFDLLIRYANQETNTHLSNQIREILALDADLMSAYEGILLLKHRTKGKVDIDAFLHKDKLKCKRSLQAQLKKQKQKRNTFSILTIPIYPIIIKEKLLHAYQTVQAVFIAICYQLVAFWMRLFGISNTNIQPVIIKKNEKEMMLNRSFNLYSTLLSFFILNLLLMFILSHWEKNKKSISQEKQIKISSSYTDAPSVPESSTMPYLFDEKDSEDEQLQSSSYEKTRKKKEKRKEVNETTTINLLAFPEEIISQHNNGIVSQSFFDLVTEQMKSFVINITSNRKPKIILDAKKNSPGNSDFFLKESEKSGANSRSLTAMNPSGFVPDVISDIDTKNFITKKRAISLGVLPSNEIQQRELQEVVNVFFSNLLIHYKQVDNYIVPEYGLSQDHKIDRYIKQCKNSRQEYLITLEIIKQEIEWMESNIMGLEEIEENRVAIAVYKVDNRILIDKKIFPIHSVYSDGIKFINSLAYTK